MSTTHPTPRTLETLIAQIVIIRFSWRRIRRQLGTTPLVQHDGRQSLLRIAEGILEVVGDRVRASHVRQPESLLHEPQHARELHLRVIHTANRPRTNNDHGHADTKPELIAVRRRNMVVKSTKVIPCQKYYGAVPLRLGPLHHGIDLLDRPVLTNTSAVWRVVRIFARRCHPADSRKLPGQRVRHKVSYTNNLRPPIGPIENRIDRP